MLAFAADGQALVSGGHDWTIRFWDVNDGTQLRRRSDDAIPAQMVIT